MAAFLTINVGDFVKELDATPQKIQDEIRDLQQAIVMQLVRGLVHRTPVDTGRARASVVVTVGRKARTRSRRSRIKHDAGTAIHLARLATGRIDGTETAWVTGSVEYYSFLNEGHSPQAKPGFVNAVVASVKAQFE